MPGQRPGPAVHVAGRWPSPAPTPSPHDFADSCPARFLSAPDPASDQDRRGRCSYALHCDIVRAMEVRATVTSKGQVTIPVAVREALGIRRGTRILFRVEDER